MIKDNDIIKALERCTSMPTSTTCLDCPYSAKQSPIVHFGEEFCKDALLRNSLGLIKRQKAEIERLEKLYELAVAEREANVKGFTESLETAKADAIKDITGYLESEIEDSDKRINEFDTSDEERGYNKGLRVALSYVQEFAEGV